MPLKRKFNLDFGLRLHGIIRRKMISLRMMKEVEPSKSALERARRYLESEWRVSLRSMKSELRSPSRFSLR